MTGDLDTYTCTLPATNISGYASYDLPLPTIPHTSYTHSCTLNSFNTTALVLQKYHLVSSAGNGDKAFFTVYNPGPGDVYAIRDMPVKNDGKWHGCAETGGALPWQLISCYYLLDRVSGKIGLTFQWYCDDRDPFHA